MSELFLASTDDRVVVGYVRPLMVHGKWVEHLLNLSAFDADHKRRIAGVVSRTSSANISAARNGLCEGFLEHASAPWLLMLDTDMTFDPDVVERLLEHADEDKAPIVGGLCFTVEEDGRLLPTLFDITGTPERPEFVRYHEFPADAMMQVFATGAACLLIHRRVLEGVRDYADPARPGTRGWSSAFPWFQETDFYGRRMSEDTTFCLRAGAAGFPVHVNTAVKLGHIKSFEADHDRYAAQRALYQARREVDERVSEGASYGEAVDAVVAGAAA